MKYESLLPHINLFKTLETFSTYSDKAFGNSSIIKIGNKVGFLKKNYLETHLSLFPLEQIRVDI